MSEEFAYARKASGLVRGLSMMDAFAVGFMNQGITPSMYLIFTLGLGSFLGRQPRHRLGHQPRHGWYRLPDRLGRPGWQHAALRR